MEEAAAIAEQAQAVMSLMVGLTRDLLVLVRDPAAGLSVPQLRVFNLLSEGERTMSSLGRELEVSQSAMTQIADRLERAGLVRRVASGTDRRIRCLHLTPLGEELLQKRKNIRQAHMAVVLKQLSADQRRDVLRAMETLLSACRASKEADASAKDPKKNSPAHSLSGSQSSFREQETALRVSQ